MQLRWLFVALASSILLAVFHFWALADFLYWRYRWFDIPMHVLGGVAIGAFAVILLRSYRPISYFFFVLSAAVAWEVFEHYASIATVPGESYVLDTMHDLLNDALGAVLVYIVARFSIWKPEAIPMV